MKIEGANEIPAPQDKVWAAFLDPATLGKAIPGCEGLEEIGPGEHQAGEKVGVGATRGADPGEGECAGGGGDGPSRCLYRSLLPSAGIVSVCETDTRCRVGAYHGPPETPTWFAPPPGRDTLPRPTVRWHTATLGEARFDVGPAGTLSYFFEARRQRISGARAAVLDVDVRRSLFVAAEERALV